MLLLLVGDTTNLPKLPEQQVPATFLPTKERVLVLCAWLQLSQHHVKTVPPQQLGLQLDTTQCVRLSWYRDSTAAEWEHVVSAPVKTLLDTQPWGHNCPKLACQCNRWHPQEEGTDLILALWDRQYLSDQMARTTPKEAHSFHFMARIPATALPMLHGTAGQQGFYVEPRLPDGRTPDPSFAAHSARASATSTQTPSSPTR